MNVPILQEFSFRYLYVAQSAVSRRLITKGVAVEANHFIFGEYAAHHLGILFI